MFATLLFSMIDDENEKTEFIRKSSQELNMDEETLKNYLNQYMRTVNAISSSVLDICNKKLVFDNDKIAQYTKNTYAQETIRAKLLETFDEAIEAHKVQEK